MKEDLIKASPPVAVTGMEVFGVPLPELVQIATLVYLVVLVFDKLPQVWENWSKRGKSDDKPTG